MIDKSIPRIVSVAFLAAMIAPAQTGRIAAQKAPKSEMPSMEILWGARPGR